MPRITYKTIIIRQFEQSLIATSLFGLILDSDDHELKYSFRLEFEDDERNHMATIEFCETCSPID
jgi:hypothetical protein